MFQLPERPVFPDGHAATWEGSLRYEDVAQDGRLVPIALPPQLAGLWRTLLNKHPGNRAATRTGVIPILTRLVLATTTQHIRLDRPVESRGGYQFASGDDKIYMNLWSDTYGLAGRLVPPEPPGELALAGSMFAEHTFTRPFAPPDQRRVTRLDIEGLPAVPEARYAGGPVVAPDGATLLDELSPDAATIAFTLDQTDSNQHVNSLVYIRLFLEAAQRRFARLQQPLRRRSRAVEIQYRKPCFAGDQVRIVLRAFALGDGIGAIGHVEGAEDGKPRCYVRTIFST